MRLPAMLGILLVLFLTELLFGKIEALAGDYPGEENRVFEAWTG